MLRGIAEMNGDTLRLLLRNFPNFMGLVVLAAALFVINNQTNERLDRQFDALVSCLSPVR